MVETLKESPAPRDEDAGTVDNPPPSLPLGPEWTQTFLFIYYAISRPSLGFRR